MILEKVKECDIKKINDDHNSDCRHLKKLVNGYFEGTDEERFYLLKNIEELENEFCNITSSDSRMKDINNRWRKAYSDLKLSVYQSCGYTSRYPK